LIFAAECNQLFRARQAVRFARRKSSARGTGEFRLELARLAGQARAGQRRS